jgi:CRISPR/Cas system-associated endoribonuclease Cas2
MFTEDDLLPYEVATTTNQGRRRLERAAKAGLDYGQRVRNPVFECQVDPERWTRLRPRLLELCAGPSMVSADLRMHFASRAVHGLERRPCVPELWRQPARGLQHPAGAHTCIGCVVLLLHLDSLVWHSASRYTPYSSKNGIRFAPPFVPYR